MATIKWTYLSGDFATELFQFLSTKGIEGYVDHVYPDTKGIPTLGAGYALITGNPGSYTPNTYILDELSQFIGSMSPQMNELKNYLNDAITALDAGKGLTNDNPFYEHRNDANLLGWTLSNTVAAGQTISDAQRFFNGILPRYITTVQTWLGSSPAGVAAFNAMQNSQEMLVFTSLAYNGYLGIQKDGKQGSPNLKAAILSGNRAEAWYEIRYNTGGSRLRDYAEAALFGLYDNGGNGITKDEALQVYQMCTKHGLATLLSYDEGHRTALSDAMTIPYPGGTTFPKAQALATLLYPAEQVLLGNLANDYAGESTLVANALEGAMNTVAFTDVYAAGDASTQSAVAADNNPSVLLGGSGADYLVGGSGNDIIIGGSGKDTLYGSGGDDTIMSGTGNDTVLGVSSGNDVFVYHATGLNSETIVNPSGNGQLWIDNQQVTGAGLTVDTTAGGLVWTAADGTKYTFSADATNPATSNGSAANSDAGIGTLTISNGEVGNGAIVIDGFDLSKAESSSGFMGITLKPSVLLAKGGTPKKPSEVPGDPNSSNDPAPGAVLLTAYVAQISDQPQTVTLSMTMNLAA